MADTEVVECWDPRERIDEELEFFTELALHETERWIEVSFQVTDSRVGWGMQNVTLQKTRWDLFNAQNETAYPIWLCLLKLLFISHSQWARQLTWALLLSVVQLWASCEIWYLSKISSLMLEKVQWGTCKWGKGGAHWIHFYQEYLLIKTHNGNGRIVVGWNFSACRFHSPGIHTSLVSQIRELGEK